MNYQPSDKFIKANHQWCHQEASYLNEGYPFLLIDIEHNSYYPASSMNLPIFAVIFPHLYNILLDILGTTCKFYAFLD
ncbi:MAG: hypothetical protein ACTSUK_05475 [Promethearchaeota archaeon]